jgi:hypothetical protein
LSSPLILLPAFFRHAVSEPIKSTSYERRRLS